MVLVTCIPMALEIVPREHLLDVQCAADAPEGWRQDRAAEGDEKFYLLRGIAEKQLTFWFCWRFCLTCGTSPVH
jgi:hypothetical protein